MSLPEETLGKPHIFTYSDRTYTLPRHIVLVGMMGAGKTSLGKKIAKLIGLPFIDSDREVEEAAGCAIKDYFEDCGEEAFRKGESLVISRLLRPPLKVISTGGGAYVFEDTRKYIQQFGISIWVRTDKRALMDRLSRRTNRPLIDPRNPRESIEELIKKEYPIYEQADIIVDSFHEPVETTAKRVLWKIYEYMTLS